MSDSWSYSTTPGSTTRSCTNPHSSFTSAPASNPSSEPLTVTACSVATGNNNSKKKERWLVTRKTWRYMADAGKLLIPEVLRKGKDLRDYSSEDMIQLDDTYQRACDQQQEFVIWEGPLVDPRILLAKNRIATGIEVLSSALRARWYYEDEDLEQEFEEDIEEEDELEEHLASGEGGERSALSTAVENRLGVSVSEGGTARSVRPSEMQDRSSTDRGRKQTQDRGRQPLKKRTSLCDFTSKESLAESGPANEGSRNLKRTGSKRKSAGADGNLKGNIRYRKSSGGGMPGTGVPQLMKGGRSPRRTGSGRMAKTSTARMSSFGGFGPSGSAYKSGFYGGGFDSKLRKRESSRHGFFPSPYGTGMLPTSGIPDFNFDPMMSKFRLMLPVGEKPPEGFEKVGNRNLPMGEIPNYCPPSSESYLQLPSGMLLQELPSAYATEEDRDWYSRKSSSAPDSGILSPTSQEELEQVCIYDDNGHMNAGYLTKDVADAEAEKKQNESGIGSGADSIGATSVKKEKKVTVAIQTEPMPDEFFILQLEEKRKKEEEERLAREAEEKQQRESEEMEAAIMGDSVMRYLKMVRRNSKSADHKKADRFRSMNYDPTLRNIKSRYLMSEDQIKGMKNEEIQAGEPLVSLLKRCTTAIDPMPDPKYSIRKLSQAISDLSTDSTVGSPQRRYSLALPEEPLMPFLDDKKDFFSQLYSGNIPPDLESGAVPEDYYNYLEAWYRAQKGLNVSRSTEESQDPAQVAPTSGIGLMSTDTSSTIREDIAQAITTTASDTSNLVPTVVKKCTKNSIEQQDQDKQQPFKLRRPVQQPAQEAEQGKPIQLQHVEAKNQDNPPSSAKPADIPPLQQQPPPTGQEHTGIYIPVSALQNLRASLPVAPSNSTASSAPKSSTSLGKPQSFLSSVISAKSFIGLGNLNSTSGGNTGRILSKKLWRPRSKSQSRPSVSGGSLWTPQVRQLTSLYVVRNRINQQNQNLELSNREGLL